MKYMILIHGDESQEAQMTEAEGMQLMTEYMKFGEELEKAGAYLGSERLRPVSTATTVRVREGKTLTTDGPFAETKEQLGGYYLIEAPSLDQALEWAAKVPSARTGSVEVRPIWPEDEYLPQ